MFVMTVEIDWSSVFLGRRSKEGQRHKHLSTAITSSENLEFDFNVTSRSFSITFSAQIFVNPYNNFEYS